LARTSSSAAFDDRGERELKGVGEPVHTWALAAGNGFLFADRGDVALRGFEDPARLYEVRWQEAE
jgi:class 3 adenylate cyclase